MAWLSAGRCETANREERPGSSSLELLAAQPSPPPPPPPPCWDLMTEAGDPREEGLSWVGEWVTPSQSAGLRGQGIGSHGVSSQRLWDAG